jgi:tRNA (guanine-N7-)-methyltransferase
MAEHDDPRRYIALAPAAPEGAIDVASLFPAGGDLEIEIGFGRGMFLIERAAAAPESRILGIEIKRKWAYLVEQRCKRLGLDHVRVFGGDARDILLRLGPEGVFSRVFMHFPDPWWKKRHEKRRLRGPQTFDPVARLLRPGGELFIQTDVEERATTFVDDLRAHEAFSVPEPPYLTGDNPYGARSNREKRAIEDGLPVFRILVRRR